MKNPQVLWALLIMCFFSYCKKDIDDDFKPMIPIDNGVMLTTTIGGFVYDENDDPVSNAEVKLDNTITTTDQNGIFIFKNILTNSKDTYLKIEKEGYLHSSKRVYPFENTTLSLRFELLPKTVINTFSSATGGNANLNNGSKVFIPPNGVKLANGGTYSGNVNVVIHHLDPTTRDLINKMPGDLTGINTDGNLQVLQSFGMLGIELLGDNGELLQIADGEEATLIFPVVSSQSSTAPETIPLWYFDEDIGRWIEEGSATKEGNTYLGKVSHFSFWNCDVPNDFVFINGKVIDLDSNPISQLYIKVISQNNGDAYSITDSEGNYAGYMPNDEVLNFTIYPSYNFCGSIGNDLLYEEDHGPFSIDTDMEDITITAGNVQPLLQTNLQGSIIGCNAMPVNNGYIKIFHGNKSDFILPDGNQFSKTFYGCVFDELTVIAFDIDNLKSSVPSMHDLAENINTGTIEICDQSLDEYIVYTLDGETHLHESPLLFIDDDRSMILGTQGASPINLTFEGLTTGVFSAAPESLAGQTLFSSNPNVEVTLFAYGGQGELVTGAFEGTYTFNDVDHVIEGSFNLTNNTSPPAATCPIPATSFTGDYLIESIAGNENCFGGIYDTNTIVSLSYISEYKRGVELTYLSIFGGFNVDAEIEFACGETRLPIIDTGVGCSGSILQAGGFPLEEYDENDDSEFQINIIDFLNSDCGCPAVTGNIYKFTKQ